MESGLQDDEVFSKVPARFFDRMIGDISTAGWVRILDSHPIVKREVLEGFSQQPGKYSKMLHQPLITARLRRRLQSDRNFLKIILAEWKAEQPSIVSFLAMLDGDFIAGNLSGLIALVGPERFCIGLYSLGLLSRHWKEDAFEKEGAPPPGVGIFDLLTPVLDIWGDFIEKNPDLSGKFLEAAEGAGFLFDMEEGETAQETPGDPGLKDRFRKVEKKLQKARLELDRAVEQLNATRAENEELKKRLREFETGFENKIADTLAAKKKEWFDRYQGIDLEATGKESERIESLLGRTRRALELQKKADQEYGLVSEMRARMLEVDQSLARIEAVYADSLVVHKEVEKVKEALLNEKERLLKLPGIEKVTGANRWSGEGILTRINLLDPVPANLSGVNKLLRVIDTFSEIELLDEPAKIKEAVRHKKRQIMEGLYARFHPGRKDRPIERQPRGLEDFVESGQSKRYDLYIDGYNVLLRVHGSDEYLSGVRFTKFREQFIEAVAAKSRHFARVYLVFDGVEDSTDIQANAEIIYTDKNKSSADAAIMERIAAARGRQVLLVTEDEEIISAVRDRIFALIDVAAFYMFLFE